MLWALLFFLRKKNVKNNYNKFVRHSLEVLFWIPLQGGRRCDLWCHCIRIVKQISTSMVQVSSALRLFKKQDIISAGVLLFSSPEPLAHGELLWSLDVRRPLCVVSNCFKGHLLNYWLDFAQTWQECSLKIVQMVLIHCISRSHRLKFSRWKLENLLVWNHKA